MMQSLAKRPIQYKNLEQQAYPAHSKTSKILVQNCFDIT